MRLSLLRGFLLEADGRRIAVPEHGQRLLALLGLHEGRMDRNFIAGLLWPDANDGRAHASLRSAVWRMSKLAPGLVESTPSDLQLGQDVAVDVREVVEFARRVLLSPADAFDAPGGIAVTDWQLLPGWYDDWVLVDRERIRQLYLHVLDAQAKVFAARKQYWAALESALRALHTDGLRESAHLIVVEVHLAEGNTQEAMRHYRSYQDLLWRELQVPPSEHMREVVTRTLSRRVGIAPGLTDDG